MFVENGKSKNKPLSKRNKNEQGLSYIEVMVAIVILTVGILAQISALTFSVLRVRENELRNGAHQVATSTIESIFASREVGGGQGINSWDKVGMVAPGLAGIFTTGWSIVRADPGADGIIGTADDACGTAATCSVNGVVNSSKIDQNYRRKIEISNVNENGGRIRKKKITVTVRYFVGSIPRDLVLTTMIADLPTNN